MIKKNNIDNNESSGMANGVKNKTQKILDERRLEGIYRDTRTHRRT